MPGTQADAEVIKVVDGDTIRVKWLGKEESLRVMCLDTEESSAASSKPETPWGHAAKAEAQKLMKPGDKIKLELPGSEPAEECRMKYYGSYDRPLAFFYTADGKDFQQHMIKNGYSPYYMKYGFARFPENHARYDAAEREAQTEDIGVWNQIAVNGAEMRNYRLLAVWWRMRARRVEEYREYRDSNPDDPYLEAKLDYDQLVQLAKENVDGKLFADVQDVIQLGGKHALIKVGSEDRPFDIFIPDIDESPGSEVARLLAERYETADDEHPGLNYLYIKGKLKEYKGRPEIVVENVSQISDTPQA